MLRVQLQDFPRGSEFNLGRLGTLRARRDQTTQEPYVDCESDAQVQMLRKLHGIAGPALELKEGRQPVTQSTHGKSINQIKAAVEQVEHRAQLVELQESELKHPKYPGGRTAVLQLIQQRLEQVREQ